MEKARLLTKSPLDLADFVTKAPPSLPLPLFPPFPFFFLLMAGQLLELPKMAAMEILALREGEGGSKGEEEQEGFGQGKEMTAARGRKGLRGSLARV